LAVGGRPDGLSAQEDEVKENKANTLRELSDAELNVKLQHLREETFNLRFRNSVAQLDNPLRLRGVRRDIARVITVLREHRRGVGPATGKS
jgi:large subunit ribosomal protein L29